MDKFLLHLPTELRERIEAYRWRHKLPSIAAAIRALIEDALDRSEQPPN